MPPNQGLGGSSCLTENHLRGSRPGRLCKRSETASGFCDAVTVRAPAGARLEHAIRIRGSSRRENLSVTPKEGGESDKSTALWYALHSCPPRTTWPSRRAEDAKRGGMPEEHRAFDVAIVQVNDGHASTAVGPKEVFSSAGRMWNKLRGLPPPAGFRVTIVSIDGALAESTFGLRIASDRALDEPSDADLVFVPASNSVPIDLTERHAAFCAASSPGTSAVRCWPT